MWRSWLARIAGKIGSSIVLIMVVIVVMFLLLELAPGDPIQSLVGQASVPAEFRQQLVEEFGLDRPLHERLFLYIANIATGNLGYSYANREPVLDLIVGRLGNTLALAVPSLIISSVLGILLGIAAARTRSRMKDGLISFGAVAGFSVPPFWLALLLILFFSVNLGWFPAQGASPGGEAGISLAYLVLPVVALTVPELAFKARVMRSTMIEVLGEDYIDTARSKGLTGWELVRRHGLLNSMLPMISVIGYSLGYMLAGVITIEKVFGWPGMGSLLFQSIQQGENLIVLGILLMVTVTIVIVNLLTDVVYGLVDPRVRARMSARKAGAVK